MQYILNSETKRQYSNVRETTAIVVRRYTEATILIYLHSVSSLHPYKHSCYVDSTLIKQNTGRTLKLNYIKYNKHNKQKSQNTNTELVRICSLTHLQPQFPKKNSPKPHNPMPQASDRICIAVHRQRV